MTLIVMSEGLDLSMGAVLGLAGVVLAMVWSRGGGSLIAALCWPRSPSGSSFGVANGLLVVRSRHSAVRRHARHARRRPGHCAGARPAAGASSGLASALPALYASTLARPAVFGRRSPRDAYLLFHFVLYRTPLRHYVFAIGGNRESLTLAGVRTNTLPRRDLRARRR